ncbi:hypothetical protein BZG36_00110 [Bifiguratus adelaidae]|uniref:Nnf1-domain-containing protein n=1 Tax=Bifiguratus adelaidae TaxID=1938954 RepID=A0A261Y8H7_9FUNG|nr:hypothetical protein BZG36_00110 [Bifiguratus adelaidae]
MMETEPDKVPEGPRAKKLRQILAKSVDMTLQNVSYDKLAQCFPQLHRDAPESLKAAHEQVNLFLMSTIEEEFETIIRTRELMGRLNELDRLIEEAKAGSARNGAYNPDKVTPEASVRSQMVPLKRMELQRLRNELFRTEAENKDLMKEVKQRKEEASEATKVLKTLTDDFDKAVQIATQIRMQDIHHSVTEFNPRLQT